MIILDTDHLSVLKYVESPACSRLVARIQTTTDQIFAATIVSVEEQMRGCLAEINRHRNLVEQIPGYERLVGLLVFYQHWQVISLDFRAAQEFQRLRKQRTRIGTMDLKIAAITLVRGALLLSANLRDYRQVPGLRVENWLEP